MKNCPFCSYPSNEIIGMGVSENHGCRLHKSQEHGSPTEYFVQCFNCFARGPVSDCGTTATTLWNMRLPSK